MNKPGHGESVQSDAEKPTFSNDAFISYSRKDKEFGSRLEKALEDYKPPKGLKIPQRRLVVFRDEADFTGVEYHESLERHLRNSRKMIVICSPEARASKYVNEEIRRFADARGPDNIIPVLLSGIPNNEAKPGQEDEMAFPEALCQAMEMPLAANYIGFYSRKDRINKGIFYGSWYTILSNLYDISRSEIEQRDKKRQARTRNVTIAIVSIVILTLSALLVYALISRQEAINQRAVAEERRNEAERQRFLTISQALAAYAPREQEHGRMDERAALLARQAFIFHQRNRGNHLDQIDRSLRQVLGMPYFCVRLNTGKDTPLLTTLALSRDNNWLAAGGHDMKVRLWSLHKLHTPPLLLSQDYGIIRSLTFGIGSDELFAGTEDGVVVGWKLDRAGNVIGFRECPDLGSRRILSVAISPEGDRLASGSEDGKVRVWNLNKPDAGPVILSPPGEEMAIWAVSFHPKEGRTIASGGENKRVLIWDLRHPMSPVRILEGPDAAVRSLTFSPDGKEIACGTDRRIMIPSIGDMMKTFEIGEETSGLSMVGGTVLVWDLSDAIKIPTKLSGHEAAVTSIAFSADGNILASASDDKTIRLWHPRQSRDSSTILRGHESGVASLGFTQNGQTLVSVGGGSSSVHLWDMRRPVGSPRILKGHNEAVLSIAFSPDSKRLASVDGAEEDVRIWDLDLGKTSMFLPLAQGQPVSVVYHPTQEVIVSGSKGDIMERGENNVHLWDIHKSGKPDTLLPHAYKSPVRSVAFSTTGELLASAGELDRELVIWDIVHLQRTRALSSTKTPANISSLAFSPGDHKLAGACGDNTVRVWDLDQPTRDPVILSGQQGAMLSVAFGSGGQTFFSGDENGTLYRWNFEEGEWSSVILGKGEGGIYSLAVNTGGTSLASAGSDGRVRVWNPDSLSSDAIVLKGPGTNVYAVAFSPNDRWLAAGGSDKTVIVWPCTEALAEMVCEKVSRNLSKEEWERFIGKDIPHELTCPDLPLPVDRGEDLREPRKKRREEEYR